MDDKWALGNQMLMTNTPNATPITVSYVNDDGTVQQLTDNQGFLDYGGFNIAQHGTATNKAFYLSDSWRVGHVAVRPVRRASRTSDATNNVCNLSQRSTCDGNPLTLYDNSAPGLRRHVRAAPTTTRATPR